MAPGDNAVNMEPPVTNNPLMVPEILHLVLIHLKSKDLLHAMQVNSIWASVGREYKWKYPPCWILTAVPKSKAQKYAPLVRSLRFDDDEDDVGKLQAHGLKFTGLRRLNARTSAFGVSATKLKIFMGAQLTHLTVVESEWSKGLFKTLGTHCFGLRRLNVSTGVISKNSKAEAVKDLQYLPVLFKQCTGLVEVSIDVGITNLCPPHLSREITDSLKALPKLKKLVLSHQGLSQPHPMFNIQLMEFVSLQSLVLTDIDAGELTNFLPHASSLQELRVMLSSTRAIGLLPAVSQRTELKTFSVDLSSVTENIPRSDVMSLKALTKLESLSVYNTRTPIVQTSVSKRELFELLTSLSDLKRLVWKVYGDKFRSAQFKRLGRLVPALEFVDAPLILELTDLEDNVPVNDIAHELHALYLGGNGIGLKDRKSLFPHLRRINLRAIEFPKPGSMNEDFEPPDDVRFSGDWMDYLEKLGDLAASRIMRQMPEVKKFVTSEDHAPLHPGLRGFVPSDILEMWQCTMEKAMLRKITIRDGWYENEGDEDDYAFEQVMFSDSEDDDSDLSDREEAKRVTRARKVVKERLMRDEYGSIY